VADGDDGIAAHHNLAAAQALKLLDLASGAQSLGRRRQRASAMHHPPAAWRCRAARRDHLAHKGEEYPGEHKAIIDQKLWDEVREVIANNRLARGAVARATEPALLRGLIFAETGAAMTPHHTKRKCKRYCHYTSMDVIRKLPEADLRGPQRLPGAMVEDVIIA
jgi:hypothetical protein